MISIKNSRKCIDDIGFPDLCFISYSHTGPDLTRLLRAVSSCSRCSGSPSWSSSMVAVAARFLPLVVPVTEAESVPGFDRAQLSKGLLFFLLVLCTKSSCSSPSIGDWLARGEDGSLGWVIASIGVAVSSVSAVRSSLDRRLSLDERGFFWMVSGGVAGPASKEALTGV